MPYLAFSLVPYPTIPLSFTKPTLPYHTIEFYHGKIYLTVHTMPYLALSLVPGSVRLTLPYLTLPYLTLVYQAIPKLYHSTLCNSLVPGEWEGLVLNYMC